MYNLKHAIILLIFILSSCSQNFQNNGLSEKKIQNFNIKIGETSKKYLINNYGPPIFENVFNNKIIYYISHETSYKTFDNRKTNNLIVLEITLNEKDIIQKIKKYSDKDGLDLKIAKNQDDFNLDLSSFWKNIIRALRRKNTED